MRLSARTSAAGFTAVLLVLLVVVPGLSSATPATSSKDVIVVNEPAQPVPVTGTVNVGNTPAVTLAGTPTVQVANEPFQQLFAETSSGSGEDCDDPLEVPEGRAVMLQSLSVEGRVFGPDAGLRPNVYLLIFQNGNLVRFQGELFEREPDVWGGFWDVDVLVQPGLSSVSMCVKGSDGGSQVRGFATGYFLF